MAASVAFDYVEYGFVARYVAEGTFYLDVGNAFLPGVIDHHHVRNHPVCKSATRMIYELLSGSEQKELWPGSLLTRARIEKYRGGDRPVRIFLHQNPDFDALVSAFFLHSYLLGKSLPENDRLQGIVDLADQADSGNFSGEVFEQPNWYFALEVLLADVQEKGVVSVHGQAETLREVFFARFGEFIDSGQSGDEFFAVTGLGEQINAFMARVESMEKQAGELLSTSFPVFELDEKGKGRIVPRRVFWIEWTENLGAVFNLYKARFREKGGPIWVLHDPNGCSGRGKLTFSLESEESYSLFGYGWALEQLETERRMEVDDSRYPLRLGPPRPGYAGFDPWYDGRGHTYTIVDSPNCGTVLLGREGRAGLEKDLAFDNARWSRYRVDALLDILRRMGQSYSAEVVKSADKDLNEELKTRWEYELKGLSPVVAALIDDVATVPTLRGRLTEGLVGFSLMIGQDEFVSTWLEQAGAATFSNELLSPEERGVAGEIFLTCSSYRLLQLAGDLTAEPSCLPMEYLTDPRRELYQALTNLAPSLKQTPPSEPSFVRICEYVELLRQLKADRADQDRCLWHQGLPGLFKMRESELMAMVGVDNPMLQSIRSARQKISFLLGIYDLALTAGMGDPERLNALRQEAHLDASAKEFLEVLIAFYEQVLRLGETMDRHEPHCRECRRGIRPLLNSGALKSGWSHGSVDLTKRLNEVRLVLHSVREAIKHERAVSTVFERARSALSGFAEQGASGTTPFSLSLIAPGITDCLNFLQSLRRLEDEILELLENGDEGQIESKAQELLLSISLEEAYDRPNTDLQEKLQVLYPSGSSGHAIKNPILESLLQGRRSLKRQRKSASPADKNYTSSTCLRAMHLSGQELLLDLPYSFKKASLGKLIRNLQKKMSLKGSSDLIDVSFGRSLTRSSIFRKLFLPATFPFSPAGSASFMFYFWLLFAMGFIAATATAEKGGFVWFTAGLSFYLMMLTVRFLKPGWGTKDRLLDEKLERELLFGQIMPRFLVPMALCLSPFIMSAELGAFLYVQVRSIERFLFLIAIFGGLSLFALAKCCHSENKGNIWRGFATLWGQSLILAYLIPIFLQNFPLLFDVETHREAIQAILTADIAGIPRMVELFSYGDVVIYAFPVASVLFSFLCLFVAIFLEELGK
ncbi:MAG: hypothetical protein R2940_05105 [Syntrophotaleaceae bacterium]